MAVTIPASNACASRTLHGMTIWTRSGFLEGGASAREAGVLRLLLLKPKAINAAALTCGIGVADLGGNAEEPGT